MNTLRDHLSRVESELRRVGEGELADRVASALEASDEAVERFAISNELWGGAGSIADQAGIDAGKSGRRRLEEVLVALGQSQIEAGKLNVRTTMWVEAFMRWQRDGV